MNREPGQGAGLLGLYRQGLVPLRRVVFVPQEHPDVVQVPDDIDLIRLNEPKARSDACLVGRRGGRMSLLQTLAVQRGCVPACGAPLTVVARCAWSRSRRREPRTTASDVPGARATRVCSLQAEEMPALAQAADRAPTRNGFTELFKEEDVRLGWATVRKTVRACHRSLALRTRCLAPRPCRARAPRQGTPG